MTPLIPAMLGGGMIKVLVIVLPMLGLLKADSQSISFLAFLEMHHITLCRFFGLLSFTKLKVTPALAMSVAGILLHPNFVQMVSSGDPLHF